jgi:hypothetical protein
MSTTDASIIIDESNISFVSTQLPIIIIVILSGILSFFGWWIAIGCYKNAETKDEDKKRIKNGLIGNSVGLGVSIGMAVAALTPIRIMGTMTKYTVSSVIGVMSIIAVSSFMTIDQSCNTNIIVQESLMYVFLGLSLGMLLNGGIVTATESLAPGAKFRAIVGISSAIMVMMSSYNIDVIGKCAKNSNGNGFTASKDQKTMFKKANIGTLIVSILTTLLLIGYMVYNNMGRGSQAVAATPTATEAPDQPLSQ